MASGPSLGKLCGGKLTSGMGTRWKKPRPAGGRAGKERVAISPSRDRQPRHVAWYETQDSRLPGWSAAFPAMWVAAIFPTRWVY